MDDPTVCGCSLECHGLDADERAFCRMTVNGIHSHAFEIGFSVSSTLFFGINRDGRNGLTINGFELGGDFSIADPIELKVSSSGLILMPGLDRIGKWELKDFLNFDYANDSRGIVSSLSPALGGSGAETANSFVVAQ